MTKTKVPKKVLDTVYGSNPEDWRQHSNGSGWIYKTACVDETAYLHPTSIVFGDAQVYGNARVFGDAQVYGDARVYGNARVFGDTRVFGDAQVYGNARVFGDAQVFGNAQVYGNARVFGDAWEKSPLYIQGSKHALTLCSFTQIAVGCHVHDIADWLKRYKAIGRVEGYTKEQIAEYSEYLKLMATAAKRLQAESKKVKK